MNPAETPASALDAKRQKLLELLRQRDDLARKVMERIGPRAESGPPRVSYAQQRLWFLDRLVPDSPFYNVASAVRIRAPIDEAVLRATFNEIVKRHEVLRTAFSEVDGEPFQLILPQVDMPLNVTDLRRLPPAAREREAVRLAQEDAQTPFDLRRVPLLRIGLIRLADDDHVFLVNLHHIVADGWSIGVLTDEFRRIYEAFAQGLSSPVEPLRIQYADFASWQRRRVEGGALQGQLDYWIRQLAGLPVLELPTDFPRRSVQGFEGETLFAVLPRDLTDEIRQFSRGRNVTPFVTLLAGFNALLHRYTGQDDIVVGEPIANRNRVEIEPLIGFFVNSLVLKTDVSGDPPFVELLARTRKVVLEADANQDIPFEVLVDRLKPERTMGRNPLFQVSLQYFSGADAAGKQAVVPADAIHVEKGTASLDLAFDLIDSDAGLMARVEYSTELFTGETIRRMVGHYENLLRAFMRSPNLRVSRAPMLSPEESEAVLRAWSVGQKSGGGESDGRPAPCVHERFLRQAEATPDRIAIDAGDRRLSYRETADLARRLARALRSRGVAPEVFVGICLDRSPEVIVGVLGAWMAGGAYVPMDPRQPESRLAFLLADARPRLVITTAEYADRLGRHGVPLLVMDRDLPDADPAEDDGRWAGVGPEYLAYVLYTSGSTGGPKGVMIDHRALALHLDWMQSEFPLEADDRVVFKYAFPFDVSLVEMICPLLAGARVLVPDEDTAIDTARLARLIRDRGVTCLDVVPSLLAALLDTPAFASARSLRRVLCGGEAMPADLLGRLLDRMDVEFANMYGPTETTITATFWRGDTRRKCERVPIGRPAGGLRAYVLDASLNPLPALVPGELHLGGDCLARGYLGRPELTRERFIRDPFSRSPGARLYRTGDRCRFLPDGNLEFLGRIDDQVKVRGYRIELGEVESVLSASPLVRACAAAVREDDRGQNQIVAYLVPNPSEPELWPSVGEYFIYDELLYHAMTSDGVRTGAYRRAIDRLVRDKVVVDVGCGADLVLARMCLEAGARRVYAIEMLEDAARRAAHLTEEIGAGPRLILIQGDSREVDLPEKVDVCVSELIGTIGSSEGVIDLLNDARRFLRPGGAMLPARCVTRIAAVRLPDDLAASPRFRELPGFYASRIFAERGGPFDIRVCVRNLPATALVSESGLFEDLSFVDPVPREDTTDVELKVTRPGRADGFLLWIQLAVDDLERIDVLQSDTSWLPVFLPAFSPGISVEPGDVIRASCSRLVEGGAFTPDYLLRGSVHRGDRLVAEFTYESRRDGAGRAGNPFYRELLGAEPVREPSSPPLEERRLSDWEALYERIYADTEAPAADSLFDIVGWNSSYTGQPLGADEMREQVEQTVRRIRELGGRRLLEIGCGTGLLVLRLAPQCQRYVATDFSPSVVETVRSRCRALGLDHVEVLRRRADDLGEFEPGSFDVVVLNSVVQYFPDMDYLVRVLTRAARLLDPGGRIFVGDVRSLPLLAWLDTGIELVKAGDETTLAELAQRVDRRVKREQELVIDPAFFPTWVEAELPTGAASVELKRGRHHNELTKFRYDAVIRLQGREDRPDAWVKRSWKDLGSVAALGAFLRESRPGAALVREIPSARLADERRLVELLQRGPQDLTVAGLREELARDFERGVEPEALWELEDRCGYHLRLQWSVSAGPGHLDAWCIDQRAGGRRDRSPPGGEVSVTRPWSTFANEVLGATVHHERVARDLREYLRGHLPEYMVPARFVLLDRLPMTPSGKIDRRALPDPEHEAPDARHYIAPRGPLETEIAAIWSRVLGMVRIGAETSFFDLGGHSLLATQVVSRLSNALGHEVPLRLIFEWPTVRGLAESLAALIRGGDGSDALSRMEGEARNASIAAG